MGEKGKNKISRGLRQNAKYKIALTTELVSFFFTRTGKKIVYQELVSNFIETSVLTDAQSVKMLSKCYQNVIF